MTRKTKSPQQFSEMCKDQSEMLKQVEDLVESIKETIVQKTEDVINGVHESEEDRTGSQEDQLLETLIICHDQEQCDVRGAKIKMTKGFVAKETVNGQMVNVVRGLTLYEDIFTDVELSRLNDFVNELRVAGHNGELSGETFILYNQQTEGNKREMIQLGVPIFGQIKEDETKENQKSCIEPIPAILQGVIEHLVVCHLLRENSKPDSCVINFFDEGEHSQPFLKPPHLEQPVSTLLLSESTMAFGHMLVCRGNGNFRGSLTLSLKKGSLLVMRGNSSDTARHAMCSSPNKRICITLFRVRKVVGSNPSAITPLSTSMNVIPTPYTMPNSYEPMNVIPNWGLMPAPMVMLAQVRPVVMVPRRITLGGTGVFFPQAVGSRNYAMNLPPRP